MRNKLGRREFLKAASAAMAASVSVASAAGPKDKKIELTDRIPAREFGKTGMKLPILGFGGAGLPKAWLNPLSEEDRVKLVRYAYDQGVRFFDTAANYMESQVILGKALKDIRDKVFLASKVETTVASEVRKAVEKTLAELQTDYLDLLQIHGTPGLEQMTVRQAMAIHGELVKLRNERVVRMVGFTAHSYFDKALALISSGGFEQCMLSYGHLPRGHDQVLSPKMVELRETCLTKAHERGMAIVAMKVVGAGVLGAWAGHVVPGFDKRRLAQLPGAAIRYVLNDKRVHLLAIGMRLQAEVDANIKTLAGDTACTQDDRTLLAEFTDKVLATERFKKMRID